MRETAHTAIVNNSPPPFSFPPVFCTSWKLSHSAKTPWQICCNDSKATKRIEWDRRGRAVTFAVGVKFAGSKAVFAYPRGGEGRGRDTLDSLVTSFAKQSGLERRIPLRFGADFAIRGAHAASLEPQWGKRVKNLSSPSLPLLIFAREQRNYAVGVRCGFSRYRRFNFAH